MSLKGLDDVTANLNRAISKITKNVGEGLREAAVFVEGESLEITPQRLGVLAGSSFSDFDIVFGQPHARVGYTAIYAAYVHEMPDSTVWTKPGTGNKFLQKALNNNHGEILSIIADAARI